jgi:hypothetical protein
LDSSNRRKIHKFLASYAEGKYADSGVEFNYESGEYIVLLPKTIGAITERACAMLKNRLASDVGIPVSIRVLTGEANEVVAAAIRKSASIVLGNVFEETIVSVSPSNCVDVIVIVNDVEFASIKPIRDDVVFRSGLLLKAMDLSLRHLCFGSLSDATPTDAQIFRLLFAMAPVTPADLETGLTAAGHTVPSIEWLKRRLDRLTREKFILWQEGDEFVLTEKGVSSLPRSLNRNSPDIQRALALARRRWV